MMMMIDDDGDDDDDDDHSEGITCPVLPFLYYQVAAPQCHYYWPFLVGPRAGKGTVIITT